MKEQNKKEPAPDGKALNKLFSELRSEQINSKRYVGISPTDGKIQFAAYSPEGLATLDGSRNQILEADISGEIVTAVRELNLNGGCYRRFVEIICT